MGFLNFRGRKNRSDEEQIDISQTEVDTSETSDMPNTPTSSEEINSASSEPTEVKATNESNDLNKPEKMSDPDPFKEYAYEWVIARKDDEDAEDDIAEDVAVANAEEVITDSSADDEETDEATSPILQDGEKNEEPEALDEASTEASTGEDAAEKTVADLQSIVEISTAEDITEKSTVADFQVDEEDDLVQDEGVDNEKTQKLETIEETSNTSDELLDATSETEVLPLIEEESSEIAEASEEKPVDTLSQTVVYSAPLVSSTASTSGPRHAAPAKVGYVSEFAAIPKKKRRRGLKVFGITMGVIAIALCIAYSAGVVIFMGRFLPNTTLGDHDISLKTNAEVVQMLEDTAQNYSVEITGPSFSYRANGADLGLNLDAPTVVEDIHQEMSAWQWPLFLFQSNHDMSSKLKVQYKPASYDASLRAAVDEYNKTATPPINATIAYDEKTNKFVVQKEVAGTQLDIAAVMAALAKAIVDLDSQVSLSDKELIQPTVLSTDPKLNESAELATGMTSAKITLIMAGKPVNEVNSSNLSRFVAIDDKLDVAFKDDELNAWCDELANGFNTIGSQRSYTRADGKAITVSGGVYGWEIDKEALKNALMEAIKQGSVTEIQVPFVTEAAVFSAPGQRDWGNRYIDVDLSEQHVRFYDENGKLFWETDCISGSPDGKHNTVEGVWKLNDKESPSTLKGYENGKKIYETKVTFWMPFEKNSIGFHDATWQPSFGGSMYANGYGSHGCVNISYEAAEQLYGIIQVGDVVVVHS